LFFRFTDLFRATFRAHFINASITVMSCQETRRLEAWSSGTLHAIFKRLVISRPSYMAFEASANARHNVDSGTQIWRVRSFIADKILSRYVYRIPNIVCVVSVLGAKSQILLERHYSIRLVMDLSRTPQTI